MEKEVLMRFWRGGVLLGSIVFLAILDPFYVFGAFAIYYMTIVMGFSLFGMAFFAIFFSILLDGIGYVLTFNEESLYELKESIEWLATIMFMPFTLIYYLIMDGTFEI